MWSRVALRWLSSRVVAVCVVLALVTSVSIVSGATSARASSLCTLSGRAELPVCPGGPIFVDATSTPPGLLTTADGSVVAIGDGADLDGMNGQHLNAPVVGISGGSVNGSFGYWLVSADGGVFSFGTASFFGSMGGQALRAPVVGMAATPSGRGYWLVAADGGVFAFGDARFFGSMGGQTLNSRVVGITVSPDGAGYSLVAADGGVFTFGDARFFGSMGGQHLNAPVVTMVATDGNGYFLAGSDGGVFAFGDARFTSSATGIVDSPVITITDQNFSTTELDWEAQLVTTSGTTYFLNAA
jgi:hypothetical protein